MSRVGQVPDFMLKHEAQLYQLYRLIGQGKSVVQACKKVEVPRASLYEWQRDHTAWCRRIQKRALADLIEDTREADSMMLLARAQAEGKLQQKALAKIETIVDQVLDKAADPDTSVTTKIRLLSWFTMRLRQGFVITRATDEAEKAEEIAEQAKYIDVNLLDQDTLVLADGTVISIHEPPSPDS